MMNMVPINDPRVTRVPIEDCGEPLLDLRGRGLVVDESRSMIQQMSDNPFLARETIADRLILAEDLLPDGYRLEIKEAWRPLAAQRHLFDSYLHELRSVHPGMGEEELVELTVRFVAPPTGVPPHSTGGAVDLTLRQTDGPVDMGHPFNVPGQGAATHATFADKQTEANRKLLVEVMSNAGFVNYAQEWWHWSYGDQYWAFLSGSSRAFYYVTTPSVTPTCPP